MASIAALTENFEAGTNGAALSTSNTIFTSITGTAPDATFVDTSYEGGLAMQMATTAGALKTYRLDHSSQTEIWYGFALRIDVVPTATTTILQAYQGSTLACTIRILTDGTIQLRDNLVSRFISPVLTTGNWYWVSVHFKPGDATGARMKVYNNASNLIFDSGNGAATSTAATAIDSFRLGVTAGTGDCTYSLDRLLADDAEEVGAPVSSSTEIYELREDFENGADGDALTSTSTIFNTITGTGPAATFAENSYEGMLAMHVDVTGGAVKTYRVDYSPRTAAWYGFALRLGSAPTTVTTICNVQQAGTSAIAFTVRIQDDRTLQLRDGIASRFVSNALTLTEWYWVSVYFEPGSPTGAQMKVYDRTGSLVYDSGVGAATSTAATQMDSLRMGFTAGTGDAIFSIDHLRADTDVEVAPIPDGQTALNVDIDADPASPEADDVATLSAIAVGATGPYTYNWSQVGGELVTLSGSGSTRTFTAPTLIEAATLTFQCEVTPTEGDARTAFAEVPILPHNFWTMHGGSLVARKLSTQDDGSLVP